jgi:hypothetical protein
MSRALSFFSGLFAAVSLIFLALSVVVVGPFAYGGINPINNACASAGNCTNGCACKGKTTVCDSWYSPTIPYGQYGVAVSCYCLGKSTNGPNGRIFQCTRCVL